MGSGIDPKVDYAFKRVFGSPENNRVLKHLLNAILSGSWPTIESVEVLNPFSLKNAENARLVILDIKAIDERGAEYLIEMQMSLQGPLAERLVYYAAKSFSQQLAQGDDYTELRPVIVICFLNDVLFPLTDDYHGCYELREATSHALFSRHWQIHLVELPKFHRLVEQIEGDIERWTYFLQHGEELEAADLPPTLSIPEIAQAAGTLTMISQTENERELYEARLKFQRDESARLKHARSEGLAEGELREGRKTLLRLGRTRFGQVPQAVSVIVEGINDLHRLHALFDHALDAPDWKSLFPEC